MKRRSFLKSATIAGAAGSVPLVFAKLAAASPPRYLLLRAESSQPGAAYRALDAASCADCGAEAMRVRMDGMHLAPSSSLRELSLSAMFDVARAPKAPFIAWHYAAGSAPRMSQRLAFTAGRASMRGFELEYRHAGDAVCRTQSCALTRFEAPLLAPGHYVVVDASAPAALAHSGDGRAPLGSQPGFDYLAFRIEPIA
jgi:hypothetical protein